MYECAYAFKYFCAWQNSHPQPDWVVLLAKCLCASISVSQMSLYWMLALNPIGSACTHGRVCLSQSLCLVQRQQVCRVSRPTLRCLISPRRPKEHLPSARLHNECMHTRKHAHTQTRKHFCSIKSCFFLSGWKRKGQFISVCFTKCFSHLANISI